MLSGLDDEVFILQKLSCKAAILYDVANFLNNNVASDDNDISSLFAVFFYRHIRNEIVLLIKIIHTHYLISTLSLNQRLMFLMFFRVLILSSSYFHWVLTEYQVV